MRILVIEDDPNLNNQIKLSLEDSGYSVDVAMDGEEGHFLGDTEPYDAVVLDLGLPKVDGISVLEKWRKEKRPTKRETREKGTLQQQAWRREREPVLISHVGRNVTRGACTQVLLMCTRTLSFHIVWCVFRIPWNVS